MVNHYLLAEEALVVILRLSPGIIFSAGAWQMLRVVAAQFSEVITFEQIVGAARQIYHPRRSLA